MYLWHLFWRARRGIVANGLSRARLTWESLDAMTRQLRYPLNPWECEVLFAMDSAFATAVVAPGPSPQAAK